MRIVRDSSSSAHSLVGCCGTLERGNLPPIRTGPKDSGFFSSHAPPAPATAYQQPTARLGAISDSLTTSQRLRGRRAASLHLIEPTTLSTSFAATTTQRRRKTSASHPGPPRPTTRPLQTTTEHYTEDPQRCDHYSCCWQAQSLLCKAAHHYPSTSKQ